MKLTPKQKEIMELLVRGKMNKEIAHELDINEHTVKMHVNRLMLQYGCNTRGQLAWMWFEEQLEKVR